LRIAMVAPPWYELPPLGYGGLEVIVAALIDGLVERGHDVTLFGAGNRTGTRARFVSTTGQLQYPRLGELMPAVLHTARVNRLIAAGDFDVVHDHTTDGPLSAPARRPPTLVTVHGDPNGEYGDYLAALGDSIGLVAISRTQRLSRTELNWVATVHNALAEGAVEDCSITPDGPVLWLARFTPDKGPDQAVRACRTAGVPLVLAGKCNETEEQQYLDEEIRPLLHDSVKLITNPDRPETHRLLREARCLIMPIRWEEPFGMVMIEAMAVGTPVVGVGLGAVPELVQHGVTGWIADDPEELPELLRRVHELDAAACAAHVRANFSAGMMAQRYEQVYLDEMARHRAVTVPKAAVPAQKHRWKPGGPVRSTPGHPASHPPGFAPD
jgi:glycosyltransferase involved in cell wall biosynthesis